jgi:HK97 family phage portal protein
MNIGQKFIRTIKAARSGWSAPSMNDESGWTGGSTWGGDSETLIYPEMQVRRNRSWVAICINYNARSVASQTLRLYVTRKTGASANAVTRAIDKTKKKWLYAKGHLEPWLRKSFDIEEVTDHPFLDMMKNVNPIQNQSDLWMESEIFNGLTGNAVWWMRPNVLGVPFQIWTLESHKVTPKPGPSIDQFILKYVYWNGRKNVDFEPQWICHHKYPNPDSKMWGLSPLAQFSDAVLVNENIYHYARAQFRNNAMPEGVLEMEESLGEAEYRRLKKEWNKEFGGMKRVGRMALLEGGVKAKALSISPKDMRYIEGGKKVMIEVAAGYGVPVALLTPDESNKSVSETAYAQYARDTVAPKLSTYEQKMNEQVMIHFSEELFVAFDDCIPENKEFGLKERESKLSTGYSTINQLRQENGEDPQKGWGDKPIMQAGMAELGSAPPAGEEEGDGTEPKPKPKPAKPEDEEEEPEKALARKVAAVIMERLKN